MIDVYAGHIKPIVSVVEDEVPDAGVDVVKQRAFYIIRRAGGIYTGEIKAKNEIEITLWSRIPADRQMAEHRLERVFAGNIVVVLQHGQEQALAKTARADKELRLGLFQQWYGLGAVAVKIALCDDLSEIRHSVGEFYHLSLDTIIF